MIGRCHSSWSVHNSRLTSEYQILRVLVSFRAILKRRQQPSSLTLARCTHAGRPRMIQLTTWANEVKCSIRKVRLLSNQLQHVIGT